MLRRLLKKVAGIFKRPREHYAPSGDPFLELDVADVMRELRPRELGKENGARELPPHEANGPDHIERGFVAFFAKELERCVKECELRLTSYAERLRGLRAATAIPDLKAISDSTRRDLLSIADRGRNELFSVQKRLSELHTELRRFQNDNRLHREPRYPDSRWLHYGVLVLLLVVETVLNGAMLARGNDFGLIGGFAQALVLAVINVAVGFGSGRWALSNAQHLSPLRRSLGIAWIVVLITFSVGFNLSVGHFRDALGNINDPYPERSALTALSSHPFVLADMQSYALLVLGLLFSVIATADGYKIDDPYPGYGALARRVAQVEEDFIAERREYIDDMADLRNDSLRSIREIAQSIELAGRQSADLVNRQQLTGQRFRAHVDYLNRSLMAVVSEYRAADVAARATPAPAYFQQEMRLADTRLPDFGSWTVQEADLTAAISTANKAIAAAHDEAVVSLRSVEDLSSSGLRYETTAHAT